ncbi:Protein timeless [Nymphon striatum]|nr:Protein timeless [Nymphon striatum]KAG1702030.1 Protein timeless [Nymphon striatum]
MDTSVFCAELTATCNALGYLDNDNYFKEPDCLITLKDMIRYLKHDGDDHEVRRHFGKTKVLSTDLIPILREYSDDKEILDVVLRLLVNLTNPAYLLYEEELPQEKHTRNHYLELLSHLESYKLSFTESAIWATLTNILGEILKLDWESRQEEDQLVVERILMLIRNVLYVSVNPEVEMRTDDDATIHDQVLWALHLSGMEDLLLYICNSESEKQFCMHTLEIISLIFREQTPEQLASAGFTRSISEKEKDEQELLKLREKERVQKLHNFRKFSGRPKNRRPVESADVTRRSTLSIRLSLKEFCIEFLQSAYNSIMATVKYNLMRARAEAHDETYYLWAMKFFMEFNRLHQFQVKLVSETISIQTFHYQAGGRVNPTECSASLLELQAMVGESYFSHRSQELAYLAGAPLHRDHPTLYSNSEVLHLSLKTYQELFHTLMAMDKCTDADVIESCQVLKSNIFYVVEYRDSILQMITSYDDTKHPKAYLKDLAETVHLFLKMLHQYCAKTSHLVVQRKKNRKHRKKQKEKNQNKEQQQSDDNIPEDLWTSIADNLPSMLPEQHEIPSDLMPFDPTLDAEVDQKPIALFKIQKYLKEKELVRAIALLRASRDIWPDGDIFGAVGLPPEDEFLVLKEIFSADIPVPADILLPAATIAFPAIYNPRAPNLRRAWTTAYCTLMAYAWNRVNFYPKQVGMIWYQIVDTRLHNVNGERVEGSKEI